MSQMNSIDVTCPSCNSKQSVKVWDTVNTKLNPELRTELFEGRLNSFACKKCGEVYQLDYPMLYHDMERMFAVRHCPESYIEEDDFIREFLEPGDLDLRDETDAAKSAGMIPRHLMHPHIVFDMGELVQYVRFRERVYEARMRKERTA